MDKNLYSILEVGRRATQETITAAYEALAKKYAGMPEGVSEEEAQNRLKAIREAYRVLSNPERKEIYDRWLESTDLPPDPVEVVPFWTPTKLGAAALALLVGGLAYYNYSLEQSRKRLELETIQLKQIAAKEEAERQVAEQEKIRLQRQAEELAYRQSLARNVETERVRQEGERIIQQENAAAERERQNSLRLAQQSAEAARRQSEMERTRYEAQKRQEDQKRQMEQARQDRLEYQRQLFEAQARREQMQRDLVDAQLRASPR